MCGHTMFYAFKFCGGIINFYAVKHRIHAVKCSALCMCVNILADANSFFCIIRLLKSHLHESLKEREDEQVSAVTSTTTRTHHIRTFIQKKKITLKNSSVFSSRRNLSDSNCTSPRINMYGTSSFTQVIYSFSIFFSPQSKRCTRF